MFKKILLALVFLFLLGGVVAFYFLSQPPKETLSEEFKNEAATRILGRKAQLDEDNTPTGDTEFKGKFISFSYPAKALVYEYKDPSFKSNDTRLEDFSFDIKEPRLVFNLQVLQNSGSIASIDDYPPARMRSNPSSGYIQRSIESSDGVPGSAYSLRSSASEESGFFLKDNRIYSLSVTGSNPEEIKKLFDSIVKTVSFSDEQQ